VGGEMELFVFAKNGKGKTEESESEVG